MKTIKLSCGEAVINEVWKRKHEADYLKTVLDNETGKLSNRGYIDGQSLMVGFLTESLEIEGKKHNAEKGRFPENIIGELSPKDFGLLLQECEKVRNSAIVIPETQKKT